MILTILDSTGSTQGPNERRRYLQIGLLALALLLVAVLGFRQVQRWVTPHTEIWVASADLPAGMTVSSSNVKRVKMAESALPKGAILDARALAGRELARAKQEGEPFTRSDFAATAQEATAIAGLVPEGRVLTTIRVAKGLVPYKNLKNGDRVDLIAVERRGRGGKYAKVVANDAFVVATMYAKTSPASSAPRTGLAALVPPPQAPRQPSTIGLVVALHPEDALPLAQAVAGGSIQVVLHGQAEVASGQLLELPPDLPVEFIAGAKKKALTVTP